MQYLIIFFFVKIKQYKYGEATFGSNKKGKDKRVNKTEVKPTFVTLIMSAKCMLTFSSM